MTHAFPPTDPRYHTANIEAALDHTWAIYGQWPHLSPVAYESECDTCVPEPLPSGVTLAWFDHWVMQLPNVPLPKKPVFLSEEGPRGRWDGMARSLVETDRERQPELRARL